MQLPFFYRSNITTSGQELVMDEDNSRHMITVLRMQPGEALHITDGKGQLLTATIAEPHKKMCCVSITGIEHTPAPAVKTGIGMSLLKNPVRFEWFLEKATEIGITEIFPLLCSRTEKQHFRNDRMKNVLVSALLQSRQTWLPVLHEPLKLPALLDQHHYPQKLIAHCMETDKEELGTQLAKGSADSIVLIGPEGDFTADEISLAIKNGFQAVGLGVTRLRTETAGMVAAVLLKHTWHAGRHQ